MTSLLHPPAFVGPWAFLAAFLAFGLLGFFCGALTGLAPGLHVNNVAALVLAAQGWWVSLAVALLPAAAGESPLAGLLVAAFLVAAATSHAVFDFVPSVFLGAPSEETAMSLLPGHRLLLRGEGAAAVALAARGALVGVLLSGLLLWPLRFLLANPVGLADRFRPWTAVFLAGLLVALLFAEARPPARLRRLARAGAVQALAGLLGIAVLRGPSGLAPETALFPLFSGLFGIPGLVASLRGAPGNLPPQRLGPVPWPRRAARSAVRGTLAGAAVSWMPGLSGGAAATLASVGRRAEEPRAFMVLLGAVSTSTAVLSVAVLFVIGKARSGTAAAVRDLLGGSAGWGAPEVLPTGLLLLFAAALLAAALAAPSASALGRFGAGRWSSANPRRLSLGTLLGLGGLLALLSGPPGLLVVALATLVGLVPPRAGVRRVHLMAALLLPVLLTFLS